MRRSQKSAPRPRLRLTEARTERNWSQQEVADRIGTTHLNVSRWERGLTKPGAYFRNKLSSLFGKSEHELDLDSPPASSSSPLPKPASVSNEALFDAAIPLQPAIHLVGRDTELNRLKKRLLTSGNVALTALNGLPGVGKTALAIQLVHNQEIRAHFSDGILWAALGPEPHLPGLLSRWGTMLGISSTEMASLSDSESWAIALRRAIGTRSMLLVIDDAWRLEDALTLKVGGPNCAHLVTTRFPTIATAIAADGATVLHELEENEGLTLLRMLAPAVVDHEERKAHELVLAVGGLPLALTLMGNYLRMHSYSGQTRRIDAALARLSNAQERLHIEEQRGPNERHSSLQAGAVLSLQSVFAVTDQQLTTHARTALYSLSVFPPKPNSFSEEAALTIADCAIDILDALYDAGLLESSVSGRYTMHQTIADYARLHLQDMTVQERFIAYFTDLTAGHQKDYELLEQESNLILAALESAYDRRKWEPLVHCACAFAPFLLVRGMYAVAEQHLRKTYDAAMVLGDSHGIITSLLYLGETAQNQGNYSRAETYWQEGLALALEMGDSATISALLNDLGWVMWKRGEYAEAESNLQEGLKIARERDDKKRISGLLKVLGSVADSKGDYDQSEVYLREGLVLARQTGDLEQTCLLLINLGATVGAQGNYRQAEDYFREGLALAREIGHLELIGLLLGNLGAALVEQGNYRQAEDYFREGLALAREIGHREWTSFLLINLGMAARKQREYERAGTYLHESLALAQSIGNPQIISTALYESGNLFLDQNQIKKAEASFREMLSSIPEGDQELLALAHYGLARTAAAQGNIEDARALGETSVSALETIGHHNAQEVREWLNSIVI
jgi:tetratricopeptide (TPR) repeat protein/transcriptional regulator with XRE-family HTH domain